MHIVAYPMPRVNPGIGGHYSPAMTWDPFAMLRLPRTFALERAEIERAYLRRVGEAHPDRAGPETEEHDERPFAAEINRARQDLLDPETRGNVLLGLLGGPSKEADRSLPDGFLMEMMEVRGEMEADSAVGGGEIVDKWEAWGEARRAEHIRAAGELFAEIERAGATATGLKAIRTRLNAWRYIERMLEQVGGGDR